MNLGKPRTVLAAILVAGFAGAGAQAAGKVAPINVDKHGVALHGYDPVTYFEGDKPLKGSDNFSYSSRGAMWRFVSAENRKKFAQNQDKYMPQFGGYCAYAVSENTTADIDPMMYRTVDGKLYLNYSEKIQKVWEQDIPGRIGRAEKNWPGLHASE